MSRKLLFSFDLPDFRVMTYGDRHVIPCSGEVPVTKQALPDAILLEEIVGPYAVTLSVDDSPRLEHPIGLTWLEDGELLLMGMVPEEKAFFLAALAEWMGKSVVLEFTPRSPGLAPEPLH